MWSPKHSSFCQRGFILFLASLFLLLGITFPALAQNNNPLAVKDELLVGLRSGTSKDRANQLYGQMQGTIHKEIPQLKVHVIKVPAAARDAIERALSQKPEFQYVEKNFIGEGLYVPNDPSYPSQWHLPKISAPTGWDVSLGSSQVIIAVIDSGVDSLHSDLAGKVLAGYSFLTNTTDTTDVLGHGTAVSGTAAALTGNLIGVAGVASQSPTLPLGVLDSTNYATWANVSSAIIYATDHNAKVINISVGGPSYSSTLQNAVNYAWSKGAVIVASAGNNATNAAVYPAALTNVLAVSATNSSDALASFSSFGSFVDVSAPGQSILTTTRGGGYGYWNGTSFSSPIVSGLAALIFSANPRLTNAQVTDLVRANSDDLGVAGYDPYFGYGRVNAARALQAALLTQPPPLPPIDSTAPTANITSPSTNSTVIGTVNILVSASDNVGVSKVALYNDGKLIGTTSTSPYVFSWNTRKVTKGAHSLHAKAHDAAGNIGTSASITVFK